MSFFGQFNVIVSICIILQIYPAPSFAQTVLINKNSGASAGFGHGLAFAHGGKCYVVTPAHVAGDGPLAQLAMIEPEVTGFGAVRKPFWPGMDLAIIPVERGLEGRCVLSLKDLTDATVPTTANNVGYLKRLDSTGQIRDIRMRIRRVQYQNFVAEVDDPAPDAVIQTGTSGAFLFVGGIPVGMILEKGEGTDKEGHFMRIEEIAMNVERWLLRRGVTLEAPQNTPKSVSEGAGVAMRIGAVSRPGIDGSHIAEHMLSDQGAYVFEPEGPAVIELEVDGGQIAVINRVRVISTPQAGEVRPKEIEVTVDASTGDSSRPRHFNAGEMLEDGVFDTGTRGGQRARKVVLRIKSAWGRGPIRIDRVIIE